MNEYRIILQGLSIILLVILVYYGYRYFILLFRKRRIDSYSIASKENNILYDIIDGVTNKFKDTKYYKKRNIIYDKYIDGDITSNHIISIKILLGLFLVVIYLFECMFYTLNINIILIIIIYLVGYYIIDILLKIEYKNKIYSYSDNIMKIMIIMNNSYHINKNHKEVVDEIIEEIDGPLKKEFLIVRNDLKNGLDISMSLNKMYERTKIDKILYMSILLGLNVRYGISIIDICDRLERDINNREKIDNYIMRLDNTNKLLYLVLCLLPVLTFIISILFNNGILDIVFSNVCIMILEIALYILYLIILHLIMRNDI